MRVDPSPPSGPVPRATVRPPARATSREVRSDDSLHAIMQVHRRAAGVHHDPPTRTPTSNRVETSFHRQMQQARDAVGHVDRDPTTTAIERALARGLRRLTTWWRTRAAGRRPQAQAPEVATADATREGAASKAAPPRGATTRARPQPRPPTPPRPAAP